MGEMMNFPETIEEFFKQYGFIDSEGIYTNRSELIHTFRAKQWDDNRQKEINRYKNIIDKTVGYVERLTNGKTSRIDTWENVELVLETILSILKGE